MSLGWALRLYSSTLLPVLLLYFTLILEDVSAQLPAVATTPSCHEGFLSSGTVTQVSSFSFRSFFWLCGFCQMNRDVAHPFIQGKLGYLKLKYPKKSEDQSFLANHHEEDD